MLLIQSIVFTHYSFIPMYSPTRQRASEDREERKHFDVGEIFLFC